jgi:hypothetical protein
MAPFENFEQMPGCAKGHREGGWYETVMKAAVHAVLVNGVSQKRASEMHNIPRQTWRRHVKNAQDGLVWKRSLVKRQYRQKNKRLNCLKNFTTSRAIYMA